MLKPAVIVDNEGRRCFHGALLSLPGSAIGRWKRLANRPVHELSYGNPWCPRLFLSEFVFFFIEADPIMIPQLSLAPGFASNSAVVNPSGVQRECSPAQNRGRIRYDLFLAQSALVDLTPHLIAQDRKEFPFQFDGQRGLGSGKITPVSRPRRVTRIGSLERSKPVAWSRNSRRRRISSWGHFRGHHNPYTRYPVFSNTGARSGSRLRGDSTI